MSNIRVLLLLKNLLFTVLVPGTVAGYFPWSMVRDANLQWSWSAVAAVPLFALAIAVLGWCVYDFASFGRGTPAPFDAPRRLVVRGLYAYLRNPMYFGVLCALLGWVLISPTIELISYSLLFGGFFHLFVVFYEEPHLRQVFGQEYVDYCARVGRWLPGKSLGQEKER